MIVTKAAIFAAGYVFGSRAGRERYAQILEAAARASRQLEDYSARHPAAPQQSAGDRAGRRA